SSACTPKMATSTAACWRCWPICDRELTSVGDEVARAPLHLFADLQGDEDQRDDGRADAGPQHDLAHAKVVHPQARLPGRVEPKRGEPFPEQDPEQRA